MRNPRRPSLRIVAATALAWGVALAAVHAAGDVPPALTQTSVAKGVTVKVTGQNLAGEDPAWRFAVVLDTHSQDLSDDLSRTVVLVTDDGRQITPISWKGPGPGGHHREGTLEFQAPQPRPRSIEMRMQRPGEAEPRIFRWALS
jgi:hypothetical protein